MRLAGGEGGIRTPDTVARMPHFECGAFNHSATSPSGAGQKSPWYGRSHNRRTPAKQASRVIDRAEKLWCLLGKVQQRGQHPFLEHRFPAPLMLKSTTFADRNRS